jgi:hypothetical protein
MTMMSPLMTLTLHNHRYFFEHSTGGFSHLALLTGDPWSQRITESGFSLYD